MAEARWYPTATTLPNGEALVIAGQIDPGPAGFPPNHSTTPEVWQPTTNSWRKLSAAVRQVPMYPFMFVAPDGQVFNAGPNTDAQYLDPEANGGAGEWGSATYNSNHDRYAGTAVMYEPGKVLIIGGGNGPATNTCEVIDLTDPMPAWQPAAEMQYARLHVNSTILPDGSVLVTGGTTSDNGRPDDGVLFPERWVPPGRPLLDGSTSPATVGAWETLNPMAYPRLYHSTALLLPDGRVLSGGGETGGSPDRTDAEIFEPPYLFNSAGDVVDRPVIVWAPLSVSYGQQFVVHATGASSTNCRMTLVRLSSVTHSFNMNQRFNELTFFQNGEEFYPIAPPDASVCPPGHYLLFVLNDAGVPSEGRIISFDEGGCGANLTLTPTTRSQTPCERVVRVTASGPYIAGNGGAFRWMINGVAQPAFDTRSYIDHTFTAGRGVAAFTLETTPTCGGNVVTGQATLTYYFPNCNFE